MTAPLDEKRLRQIAAVAWAANTELQAQHGDQSPSLPGDLEDAEAHAVTVAGVHAVLAGATPEQLHETWMRNRTAQGWTHGPLKDSRLKTHPCLVPYADLPEHQKVKDAVFAAIVRAMAGQDAPETARLQRACETLGMVVGRQAEDLYAMWIDVSRGDLDAVKERVLNAIPDGDDNEPGEQWDGTETGAQWLERTREARQ